MPKRSSKKFRDLNLLAKSILNKATGKKQSKLKNEGKNPAAVALGKLGGLKGGKARSKKLSAERRSEIAKKAAKARWSRHHS